MSSATAKAATAITEHRVTVAKVNDRGLALKCKSATSDRTYMACVYQDGIGTRRQCTCPNALAYPIHPRCWHVRAVELLREEVER